MSTCPLEIASLDIPKNRFENAKFITTPAIGPEDVVIDNDGNIYSGLSDGSIIRVSSNGQQTEVIGKSQGAIFGIAINKKGDTLVFADQLTGVKQLNLTTREITHLVSGYDGIPFKSPNGITFGKNDQVIYFTVSSEHVRMNEFHNMILYAENTGRLFKYDFKTNKTQLLLTGLYFANGVAYNEKQNCLYFAETSKARITKYNLSSGSMSLLSRDLPGYPDNIHVSHDGNLWVSLPALRDWVSGTVERIKVLRKISINARMTLGMFLMVANMKYAGGVKIDSRNGNVLEYFFGQGSHIHCISGINEHKGTLYLSSLAENKIAVVSLNDSVSNQNNKQEQL